MIKTYLRRAKNNKRYGRTDITLLSPGNVCNELVLAADSRGLFVLRSKDEEKKLTEMARQHGEMLELLEQTLAESANDYDRCQEPNCWHCRARALVKCVKGEK